MRFTKHVDAIAPSRGVTVPCLIVVCQLLGKRPDLTVSHDVPLKAGKCGHDFAESYCWYRDFEIVVFAGSVTGQQLQRPPGRDVQRC